MNKKSLQDHIMPVDLALVNYVQDLETLFAAVTGSTEIVEENKKQNVSVQFKVKPSVSSHSKPRTMACTMVCTMARTRLLKLFAL